MVYNILLPINCYTGNITTKCHSESMSDNRDLNETFHQKVSLLPVSIASDSRYFQSSWICFSVTKYSSLQLPVKACIYREAVVSQWAVNQEREWAEGRRKGLN